MLVIFKNAVFSLLLLFVLRVTHIMVHFEENKG